MLTTPDWVRDTLLTGKFDGVDGQSVATILGRVVGKLLPNLPRDTQEQLLSMLLAAEKNRTFAMGNGIAIPHLSWPRRIATGWFLLEQPVIFSDQAEVRLLFCAIADEDRLAPLMAKACDVIARTELGRRIAEGERGWRLIEYAQDGISEVRNRLLIEPLPEGETVSIDVEIRNRRGLHARAAARLVMLAQQVGCDVRISNNEYEVSATSIMGTMMINPGFGGKLRVLAAGPGAIDAVVAVASLIERGFGEIS